MILRTFVVTTAIVALCSTLSIAAGKPPHEFTARCIDDETGSVFRATVMRGAFAYNFDAGTKFTVTRGAFWMSYSIPHVSSMIVTLEDAYFTFSYDGSKLTFELSRPDAKKIDYIDHIAGGQCVFVAFLPIPPNSDVGSSFNGPEDIRASRGHTL